MRWRGYKRQEDAGSPIGSGMTDQDKKEAASYAATSRRLRAGLRPGPENSIWGRGLSERREFPQPKQAGLGQRHPEGHARAPMVLGPFAETKGPRRAGATPRIKGKTLDS